MKMSNFSSLDMPTFRLVACHAIATAADRLRIFAKLIPGSVHARSESKVCVAMSASKDFMDFQRTVVKVNSNAKIMFLHVFLQELRKWVQKNSYIFIYSIILSVFGVKAILIAPNKTAEHILYRLKNYGFMTWESAMNRCYFKIVKKTAWLRMR